MPHRVDPETLIRGEVDNTLPGRVVGRLWIRGMAESPVEFELSGNPHRDLAGCRVEFTNPNPDGPKARFEQPFPPRLQGRCGDMTSAHKCKIPTVPEEEMHLYYQRGEEPPSKWGTLLSLEWFTEDEGRFVVECPNFQLEVTGPEWTMTEEEDAEAKEHAEQALVDFINRLKGPDYPTAPQDREMNEFEWEEFMKASDRRTDASLELHDKFGYDMEAERKIAKYMGWELPGEAFSPLDGSEFGETSWKTSDEFDQSEFDDDDDDEEEEETESIVDSLERRMNPLCKKVHDLLSERDTFLDRANQSEDSPDFQFDFALMRLSAKLAGALGFDEEEDEFDDYSDPGFKIASLKRCMPIVDEVLELSSRATVSQKEINEVMAVRQEIVDRMTDLRKEI